MDPKEFEEKTKRTEDASGITFDIRGHGDKQGEAQTGACLGDGGTFNVLPLGQVGRP